MSDAINKPAHYYQGSIECIEAMKIVLTPEEFRGYLKGNVFKYLWREKDKNGNEDLRKGKSYYDRLIELIDESEQQKAADLQSLKNHPFGKLKEPAIKQSLTTEPPDGWRILEEGEVIRDGDKPIFPGGEIKELPPSVIGKKHERPCRACCHYIRRNRFEVGEKVVHGKGNQPCEVVFCDHEKNKYLIAYKGSQYACQSQHLAPYIEDAT